MRATLALLVTAAALAGPLQAQVRQPREPLPDHWLTLDSLIESVQIEAQQRDTVSEHFQQLNALVKEAARERDAMRSRFGGGRPGPGAREQFGEFRRKMETLQGKIDDHYAAIRSLLNEDQRERFDALPKPRVVRARRRR